MSVITPSTLFAVPPFPTRRFTVAEYHQMLDAGILGENDAVELLEGWITPKMPRKPSHDAVIQIAHASLQAHLPPGWAIRIQSAITTSDSEPEPDLAVVRGSTRSYLQRHPEPVDIGLIVEVSDATLNQDCVEKGRLYARANLPYYWLINLIDRRVEVYSAPDTQQAAYGDHVDVSPPDATALILDGQTAGHIPAADLLP